MFKKAKESNCLISLNVLGHVYGFLVLFLFMSTVTAHEFANSPHDTLAIIGDKIAVTGAKGWPPSTFDFNTEPSMLKLTYVPSIQEWVHTESFTLAPSIPIVYKYYIAWDSTRIDSTSPNFIRGLLLANGWEEPGVVGGGNRTYNFAGLTDQTPAGDFGAAQQFFNSLQ